MVDVHNHQLLGSSRAGAAHNGVMTPEGVLALGVGGERPSTLRTPKLEGISGRGAQAAARCRRLRRPAGCDVQVGQVHRNDPEACMHTAPKPWAPTCSSGTAESNAGVRQGLVPGTFTATSRRRSSHVRPALPGYR